MLILHSTVEK